MLRAAKALGVDPDLPRVVAVAGVSGLMASFQNRYGASELVVERASEAILAGLAQEGAFSGQDVAVVLDEQLIVLKAPAHRRPGPGGPGVGQAGRRLSRGAVRGGRPGGGSGWASGPWPSPWRSTRPRSARPGTAWRRAARARGASTIHDPELAVGFLLAEMGAGPGGMVLRPLAGRLARCLERRPELAETVRALFAHRFELETTAFALGIHRNTLAYRLGRLKEQTGLDPVRRHDDAVLLRATLSIAMRPGPA